jgi:hypothetical protein
MAELLLLCRHPDRFSPQDAEAWLTQELDWVVRRDNLDGATLTALYNLGEDWTRPFDWLIEFRLSEGSFTAALAPGGGCGELVADFRLLGMTPVVALADSKNAIEVPSR